MRQFLPVVSCLSAFALLLRFCLFTPLAFAGEIYRYTDEGGNIVLNRQGVPPQYVDKGYQVLNKQGRVIKTVPRTPTAEERAQMAAEEARLADDERLLRLYSRPEDVRRAKESKLREFDILIEKTENQLPSLNDKLANLYQQLDESRREQQVANDASLAQEITKLKTEQRRLQGLIQGYKAQRLKAENEFEAEQARLAELLSAAAS